MSRLPTCFIKRGDQTVRINQSKLGDQVEVNADGDPINPESKKPPVKKTPKKPKPETVDVDI